MAVNGPGTLSVECDGCGEEKDFDVTEFAGSPPSWGVDETTLEQDGWSTDDSETFCPACTKERTEGEE